MGSWEFVPGRDEKSVSGWVKRSGEDDGSLLHSAGVLWGWGWGWGWGDGVDGADGWITGWVKGMEGSCVCGVGCIQSHIKACSNHHTCQQKIAQDASKLSIHDEIKLLLRTAYIQPAPSHPTNHPYRTKYSTATASAAQKQPPIASIHSVHLNPTTPPA